MPKHSRLLHIRNNFSEELKFLLASLKNRTKTEVEPKGDINDTQFIQLVQLHRVTGPMNQRFVSAGRSALRQQLDSAYYYNKLDQLKLSAELIRIQLLFSENDLDCIAFKGPVLSQILYHDPTERTSIDLDILIPENAFDKTVALLTTHGYSLLTTYKTPKQKNALLTYYHHLSFYNESLNTQVEIHWRLSNSRVFHFDESELFQRAQIIELGTTKIKSLPPDVLFNYLCIHGSTHAFFRLQWLLDLYELLSEIPAEEVTRLITSSLNSKRENFVLSSVYLCQLLFDLHLDEQIIARISSNRRVQKLCALYLHQIEMNREVGDRPRDISSRFRKTLLHHKLNFLLGGASGLLTGLIGRNVRPENWKVYAFPDWCFFLNHLFSRFIWFYGKLTKQL